MQKTLSYLACGLLALLLLSLPLAYAENFTGKVVAVTDGDTLQVMRDGKAVKVRLYGVDAPERGQDFGTQAKLFTSDLAFGQIVTVEVKGSGKYATTIGEVRRKEDARNINQELVQAGLAWWYKSFAPHDSILQLLEQQAREAKRGLWILPSPVPPWAWRKESKPPAKQSVG